MTLQGLAALAAVAELALIACACAAGFLLARGTRLPGWAAAATMLLIVRSIVMSAAFAWETPASTGSLPVVDVTVGVLCAALFMHERWRARRDRANATPVTLATSPDPVEAHADAA